MIKVLIVEDEIPARNKLKRFLSQLNESIEVVGEIDTVEAAIAFLNTTKVDLILSDIELLDGNAFEIYTQVKINCPIIFTTAYDQFLMDAFENYGIEYLLKPFSMERFQKAWDKYLLLGKSNSNESDLVAKLNQILQNNNPIKTYKERFTISSPKGIYFIETNGILFFEANEGVLFAFDTTGKKHLLNETTLKEIEFLLDPKSFFRINRSELVHKKYIERVERYSKNAFALKIKGYEKHLKTSQSNTASFREWIEQ
ncbi:LytR/AlgR family response regulator transcription factor [Flavobacterium sp. ABG]|uniref:LytR/AlgR family response regulator transcription factor n=1 Tax=Flavobacterium sp. ABG TaxID=1423322 RepID=UPI00064AF777|nr:LytTR family DNA-binding domain-containing protein [Flavobacterium sp. ABG]KLT68174.1 transcriptional regulator [Flavobacterium sp. ABG]